VKSDWKANIGRDPSTGRVLPPELNLIIFPGLFSACRLKYWNFFFWSFSCSWFRILFL